MKDDEQGMGVSPASQGPGSRERNPQAVSAADAASIPDAKRPAWWKCTSSNDRRFTAGVAYEVQEYDRQGRAVIVTDVPRTRATLPVERAVFVPHDPWAKYRAAQWDGSAQRQDREAGLIGEADDSPVGSEADDAPGQGQSRTLTFEQAVPSSNLPSPSGDRNTVPDQGLLNSVDYFYGRASERLEMLVEAQFWLTKPGDEGQRKAFADRIAAYRDALPKEPLPELLPSLAALKSDTPEPPGDEVERVAAAITEYLPVPDLRTPYVIAEHGERKVTEMLDAERQRRTNAARAAIAAIRPTPIGVEEPLQLAEDAIAALLREDKDEADKLIQRLTSLRSQGGG